MGAKTHLDWMSFGLEQGKQAAKLTLKKDSVFGLKLFLCAVYKLGHQQRSLLGEAVGIPNLLLYSSYVSRTLHKGHLKVKQQSLASCFSMNVFNVSV